MKFLILALSIILITGCTSVQVTPLEPSLSVSKICIEQNEKVIVPEFLDIVRSGFTRHGIESEVYPKKPPNSCDITLTYTATQHWDFVLFMSDAELWLNNQKGQQVAYAQYHLIGGGGFDFSKWTSTESKMNPVIDKMLFGYKLK